MTVPYGMESPNRYQASTALKIGGYRQPRHCRASRALDHTSLEEVKPAGAPGGGPFVGPYKVVAATHAAGV